MKKSTDTSSTDKVERVDIPSSDRMKELILDVLQSDGKHIAEKYLRDATKTIDTELIQTRGENTRMKFWVPFFTALIGVVAGTAFTLFFTYCKLQRDYLVLSLEKHVVECHGKNTIVTK